MHMAMEIGQAVAYAGYRDADAAGMGRVSQLPPSAGQA
jgi:hypothetical protein